MTEEKVIKEEIEEEAEEEQEEDDEELGDGIKMFSQDRTKNMTEKEKRERAKKDRSFTKKKRHQNKFDLEKCLNTYGTCQNKPKEGSNFCSKDCEKMYTGNYDFKRDPGFTTKFFEREKAKRNAVPITVNNQALE